ncbi:MAG: AAA family ATPase, partial [Deltaproteobacteria bacterium]|nr:AAA family ATPase [Deltaproteobacteria bacterium]
MISSDIKSLISKLNVLSTQALYEAGGLAVARSHYEVAVEHLLLKSLDLSGSDFAIIIEYFKLDKDNLRSELNRSLEQFSVGNAARPAFSPILLELLEASWVLSSLDLNLNLIRTGSIMAAFLRRPSIYSQGASYAQLNKISKDELEKNFSKILANSSENGPEATSEKGGQIDSSEGGTFVSKYCEDFTQKAKDGKIDQVFGRDEEIRSMIDILARRRKNNPILVGEPGVGKTAVIEGLSARIVQGDVPQILKGVRLVGLDIGLLEAGASVKGEFERRLKGVINEIKSSSEPIILFIDEVHMLVGAGGTQGGSDAANLLKPALARGELKTCAATTWKEYKRYFEKDAALARRFQLVSLDEPTVKTCELILRGSLKYYEQSHKVLVRDEAITAAASMSDRFISGRFLPDKAFDLLDTACARVKVNLAAKPASLEDLERSQAALLREKQAIIREGRTGADIDKARLDEINALIEKQEGDLISLNSDWLKQKQAAQELIEARSIYLDLASSSEPFEKQNSDKPDNPLNQEQGQGQTQRGSQTTASLDEGSAACPSQNLEPDSEPDKAQELLKAKTNFEAAKAAFEMAYQGRGPLMDIEVNAETIAHVVSDWTGIPTGRLAAEEAKTISQLKEKLTERIKGQDAAISAICEVIEASKAGLRDPNAPLGVFMATGPSGVGKTETGLTLAQILFGDEKNVVTIN